MSRTGRRPRPGRISLLAIMDRSGGSCSVGNFPTPWKPASAWRRSTLLSASVNPRFGTPINASSDFLARVNEGGISSSMDGQGRALDNIFHRPIVVLAQYELIYPSTSPGLDLFRALETYFQFYNHERPH